MCLDVCVFVCVFVRVCTCVGMGAGYPVALCLLLLSSVSWASHESLRQPPSSQIDVPMLIFNSLGFNPRLPSARWPSCSSLLPPSLFHSFPSFVYFSSGIELPMILKNEHAATCRKEQEGTGPCSELSSPRFMWITGLTVVTLWAVEDVIGITHVEHSEQCLACHRHSGLLSTPCYCRISCQQLGGHSHRSHSGSTDPSASQYINAIFCVISFFAYLTWKWLDYIHDFHEIPKPNGEQRDF